MRPPALVVRHAGHIGSPSFLLAGDDVKLCCFTVAHSSLDRVWFVPGDRCLVDEDVDVGVDAIFEYMFLAL